MIKIDKYRNLLNQTFTKAGRLNFYAVDKIDDLQKISEDSIEIIGCRAYVIENGKFYIMGSNREWHEQLITYNVSFDDIKYIASQLVLIYLGYYNKIP